jgi:pyroglutamyl-peptidase
MRSILIFALAALSAASVAEAKKTVLVTAFEPFGGRKTNGSEAVGKALVALGGEGIEYKLCVLPVEYDKAAVVARKCFEEMNPKPDMVISTGEGDCTIRVETRAHNLDDTPGFPDNAGVVRTDRVVEAGAPPHERLALPAANMVCAAEGSPGAKVRASISPGYYVCNAVAYRLARYFKPKKVAFGFIHLPVAGSCQADPKDSAASLHKMAKEALRVLSVTAGAGEDCVNCEAGRGKELPAASMVTAACVTQVREDLRLRYERERSAARQRGDIAGPAATPERAVK